MTLDFKAEYNKLNPEQKQAVDHIDGPLLLQAGPGTGKTQILSMRVANILRSTDLDAANILCLTFTEAAAHNMRDRLLSLIGPQANRVAIFTFHGFGAYIIEHFPDFFYDQPLIKTADELTEYEILVNILGKLPHNNPLSKTVGDSFLHISSARQAISWFKQAGLSPQDVEIAANKNIDFFAATEKAIREAFGATPSASQIPTYEALYKVLNKYSASSEVARESSDELKKAIELTDTKSRYAKSITQWRNKWLSQRQKNEWLYADQKKTKFLKALCGVYDSYQSALIAQGFYTFDDMILRTTLALKTNQELLLNLQEQYQYILVDEYQDTNGAQNNLLNLLAKNTINEGKPNLMVVGDEDQAIYRFQGAYSSIMSGFIDTWPETKVISLKTNYRSGQSLVDVAFDFISEADYRQQAEHALAAQQSAVKLDTSIMHVNSLSEIGGYLETAAKIKSLVDSGVDPASIAVLAPRHRYLEAFVPYLISLGVQVNYERREQILNEPRIIEILDLLELTHAVNQANTMLVEALLPKILSADYWDISPDDWWQIAITAQKNKTGWFNTVEKGFGAQLRNFKAALLVIAKASNNQPFELTLAQLIGNAPVELEAKPWYLPWREYYFSDKQIDSQPSQFLKFIGQYNTLLTKFRNWQGGKPVNTKDFMRFVGLYTQSGLSLLDSSPIGVSTAAVNVMTAYKAKGLEWDYVFLLNCQDDVWGPATRSKNHSFGIPSDLSWIKPASENADDLIKLFYVATTRAKRSLYLISFQNAESGRKSPLLRWLEQVEDKVVVLESDKSNADVITESLKSSWETPLREPNKELKEALQPILQNYKLSATHLNNFLDLDKGGPKHFLLSHILKVPGFISPNMMYGDAIHKTIELIHTEFKKNSELPSDKSIKNFFTERLRLQALTNEEFSFYLEKGSTDLIGWLKFNLANFSASDISEYNFYSENIVVGDARLTGKIDLIHQEDKKQLSVIDYKTGRPIKSWSGGTGYTPVESRAYQRQLYFYKLIIEGSTSLSGYTVEKGELRFITPDEDNNYSSLPINLSGEEADKLKELIKVVWQHIIKLDLPDTDKYPKNLTGIKAFEEDLVNGRI